jgi:putative Mg2+ transporter-C (MgtC) family protein
MHEIMTVLQEEFQWSGSGAAARLVLRVLAAVVCGAAIGLDRERLGKAAGLRTHILVCLGAALPVIAAQGAHMDPADISRVMQGLLTGIGFIGGGAILKLDDRREIRGLTTAATIWLTCAVGICVGFGQLGTALLIVVVALLVLAGLGKLERQTEGPGPHDRA